MVAGRGSSGGSTCREGSRGGEGDALVRGKKGLAGKENSSGKSTFQ